MPLALDLRARLSTQHRDELGAPLEHLELVRVGTTQGNLEHRSCGVTANPILDVTPVRRELARSGRRRRGLANRSARRERTDQKANSKSIC